MPTSARDFFDPAIQHAQFVGGQVASLTEKDVVANGGKKIGGWRAEIDEVAQLKNLERLVREDSLGKVFGSGAVMDSIDGPKVVDVLFFEMKDGTGVQIAKIKGGENSMLALLSVSDMDDLDLMPKYRAPKTLPGVPKIATLSVGGQDIQVTLAQDKEPEAYREPIDPRRAGGAIQVNMGNPLAAKAFMAKALTADSMALPSADVQDMPYAFIVTLSPEAHPDDKQWPVGIKVTDSATGEEVKGPSQALKLFARSAAGVEDPLIERTDLVEQFKARRPKP